MIWLVCLVSWYSWSMLSLAFLCVRYGDFACFQWRCSDMEEVSDVWSPLHQYADINVDSLCFWSSSKIWRMSWVSRLCHWSNGGEVLHRGWYASLWCACMLGNYTQCFALLISPSHNVQTLSALGKRSSCHASISRCWEELFEDVSSKPALSFSLLSLESAMLYMTSLSSTFSKIFPLIPGLLCTCLVVQGSLNYQTTIFHPWPPISYK